MNIIIPSAGFGKRFSENGYKDPKPFVIVKNKSIIEHALSSFKIEGNYFVITNQLNKKYLNILDAIYYKYNIKGKTLNLNHDTIGAAETCLEAERFINPNEPLIITLNDQYTPWNHIKFLNFIKNGDFDAVVTTYNHNDIIIGEKSRYSFIKTDENGIATEFAEKLAISPNALNGIHYWKFASLFFESAKLLMNSNIVTNGEKYLSLTFQFLINKHKKITYYKMEDDEFVSLGSPEEIKENIEKI